jgi:hypothetical protein
MTVSTKDVHVSDALTIVFQEPVLARRWLGQPYSM